MKESLATYLLFRLLASTIVSSHPFYSSFPVLVMNCVTLYLIPLLSCVDNLDCHLSYVLLDGDELVVYSSVMHYVKAIAGSSTREAMKNAKPKSMTAAGEIAMPPMGD